MRAGERLKAIRSHLGVSTREVEKYSRQIADVEGNKKFYISNAWLSEIEATDSIPSVPKLFTLSAIYHTSFVKLLYLFGIDLERIGLHQIQIPLPKTHLTRLEVYDEDRTVTFPVRFDKGFRLAKTTLLAHMVAIWGEVPIPVIRHLDVKNSYYGYIGLRDYTMDPLIPPGSFVQIDNRVREVVTSAWRTELDRPIYFVRLRDGHACSWCELKKNQLTLMPHPLSRSRIRIFAYPREAEIVGQVTGIAMRIVRPVKLRSAESAKVPKQP